VCATANNPRQGRPAEINECGIRGVVLPREQTQAIGGYKKPKQISKDAARISFLAKNYAQRIKKTTWKYLLTD